MKARYSSTLDSSGCFYLDFKQSENAAVNNVLASLYDWGYYMICIEDNYDYYTATMIAPIGHTIKDMREDYREAKKTK
jgi:hypothetical protein